MGVHFRWGVGATRVKHFSPGDRQKRIFVGSLPDQWCTIESTIESEDDDAVPTFPSVHEAVPSKARYEKACTRFETSSCLSNEHSVVLWPLAMCILQLLSHHPIMEHVRPTNNG